jgi:hypothetical protein
VTGRVIRTLGLTRGDSGGASFRVSFSSVGAKFGLKGLIRDCGPCLRDVCDKCQGGVLQRQEGGDDEGIHE